MACPQNSVHHDLHVDSFSPQLVHRPDVRLFLSLDSPRDVPAVTVDSPDAEREEDYIMVSFVV